MPQLTSTFRYNGNLGETLNTLTNVQNPDVKAFVDLSLVNYTVEVGQTNTRPNSENQKIFMNQPISWWLENLNSGAIRYFPFSNYVNWAFTNSSGDVHIDTQVSSLLIPDTPMTTSVDSSGNILSVFIEKFGFERTDSRRI